MSDPGDRSAAAGNPQEDPALLFEHLCRLGRRPNVQEFLQQAGALSTAQVVSILCLDQWERWHQGDRVPAESHLGMHPAVHAGTEEAFDIVFGEFLLREELEESPRLQEYLERFPQYAPQLHKQFELHRAIEESGSMFSVLEKPRTLASSPTQAGEVVPVVPLHETVWPTVPGYEIVGELGRGGMGHVYKARQQRLNRLVALKVIRQERLAQDAEAIRRFQREARAAAQLSHPNVVVVYDADQVGGIYFIAMEYVEGIDLFEFVKEAGPMPIEQACDFIRQAALGLQHAFERGLVHRDIKPSNLLVTMPNPGKGISGFHLLPQLPSKAGDSSLKLPGGKAAEAAAALGGKTVRRPGLSALGVGNAGVVKILDMGLALVHASDSESANWTQEGTLMGTPDYIAPEQALSSHDVDIRADLYSLGCTFYFLLSGKPPFGDYPLIKKLMLHQMADPKPIEELRADVPPVVCRIVSKLLRKQPDERYQTPLQLIEALAGLKTAELAPAASPDRAGPPRTPAAAPQPEHAAAVHALLLQKWPVKKSADTATQEEKSQDTETGPEKAKKICVLEGHRGWVTSVAFSADRSTLASGGVDGALRLWDLAGSEPRDRAVALAHPRDLNALAFAPNNQLLASGSGTLDGIVGLWEFAGPQPRQAASLHLGNATVDVLAFSPDSHLLACGGSDKHVRLWDVSHPEPQARHVLKGHSDFVKAIVFSPDGNLLATAGTDGSVRLWNLNRFWSKEQAVLQGHWGQVHSVAFAPDAASLAFGSLDQTVRVWELAEGLAYERLVLHGHPGVVRLVQFTPDGASILSICDGGQLILWNSADGSRLHEWYLPRAKVYSMALTLDGRYLATGNNDGSVFLFRLYPKKAEDEADTNPE